MIPAHASVTTVKPPPLPRQSPPEWPVETLIKKVGRIPGAAGRALDRLARLPAVGPVVRLFSSVWFGISILAMIGLYIAVGSGKPQIRAYFEMTDLQFFDAWPMRALLTLLALDLITVTLRRIPLTLFKLGSWTVHLGILTLIGGCVWYFSMKQEGAVRIFLHQSVNYCYDVTERALYAYPVNADGTLDNDHPQITPIPGLPIYNEHLAERGNPLDIALAHPIASSDAVVHIRGYYPSAQLKVGDYRAGEAGETGQGPAIRLALGTPGQSFGEAWLLAEPPAARVLEGTLPCAIEYLRHPSAQRLKDLQASFDGPLALTVRIPKLHIDRTYAIQDDQPIIVEGAPYTLQPLNVQTMPMLSKGYENASSSALTVAVTRNDAGGIFEFQRMCVSRYPERSPDFVTENGRQVRQQDGVDPDIALVFHDAAVPQAWIVEGPDGKLALIVRTPDGKSTTQPLMDNTVRIPVKGLPGGVLELRLTRQLADAVPVMLPAIVPPEARPRAQTVGDVIRFSMVDLEVAGGNADGGGGGWKREHVYVPFFSFAAPGERPMDDVPAVIDLPAQNGRQARKVALLLSTTRRDLPSTLTLAKFEAVKYAGAQRSYQDYFSTLLARDAGSGATRTLVPHLNNPAGDHGLYYFQSFWDGDDNAPPEKRFSVIGVGNRPGIPVMVAGAILIMLGVAYAFYAKPLLLKMKKESLARWSAERSLTANGATP